MELDADRCYQAVLSRDARFDGRFYTAVMTTGVYCRPVCPARPPKRTNVRFYACPAAAEQAGFRPCRRCRPETSPGTPAWQGSSATISRALRLIADGALDAGGVDDLAERLGMGSRHLRRLFDEHLGASPIAIAGTRRVHFARRLIDETDLPMAEVAFASGFASLRRFNDAIHGAFGRPPTELRELFRARRDPEGGAGLVLRLPYRPPYDWSSLIRFLQARAIPGVEAVGERSYARSIRLDGTDGWIEVRPVRGKAMLALRVSAPSARELARIAERARRLFDLGADPMRIDSLLARDRRIAAAVRAHPGMRVPGAWDPFELAVRAVLGQQVTVKGASTLAGRLVARFGEPLAAPAPPGITHHFPTAAALARNDPGSIGIPRARANTIRELARAVEAGRLVLDASDGLESAVARMRRIPGIGEWTAQYVAMRAFGEPDVLPSGDLGLRRAFARQGRPCDEKTLEEISEAWRPWRAYAAMHVWNMTRRERE